MKLRAATTAFLLCNMVGVVRVSV